MILAKLDELVRYRPMSTWMHHALAWLDDTDWAALPDGRHEGPLSAAGESPYYAMLSRYASKPVQECRYEAHHAYVDIQALLDGEEYIDVCPTADLVESEPYSTEKDIVFFDEPSRGSRGCRALLKTGLAAVFFPEDAHRPCVCTGPDGCGVRKLVVKIRIPIPGR
jgi:YhcH/YjgK/YiaL family protein